MRVAMFTDYYPPHFGGGVEKVAHELARGLAASDVDVRVFTLRTAGGPKLEDVDGVAVHRSSALRLTGLLRLQSAASPGLIAHTIAELRRMRPDVIHAHNRFFFSSLVAAFAAQVLRIPLVTTLHLGDLKALPMPQRLGVLAYERTLGRAIISASDRIVAVSQAVADYAQRLGATPDKTTVQPNAVDIDVFRPRERRDSTRPRIAFVGRLIQNKGPQYLLHAAPDLLRGSQTPELWFIGDGPMRASLESDARRFGANVSFLGNREDVPSLLGECDVFVRPSLMEGMPLTVLEAMASGLPVVATPVGGTPEIVEDGVTGLLVQPANVPDLTNALGLLAHNPMLRRELGRNARKRVERDFTWQRIVDDTITLYEDALGVPAPVPALQLAA